MKKGIILDIDGTLWDAVDIITESWNEYAKQNPDVTKKITPDEMRGVLGKTMLEIADILYGYLPPEKRNKVLSEVVKFEVEYLWDRPGKLYPGVRTTLQQLKEEGWHLYIVSNCQLGYIDDLVHAAEIEDLIEDQICFEDTMQEKGFNIRLCVERNHLDHAIYVGDTAGDLEAARKAGIEFICASYGFGSVDAAAEGVKEISSLQELPDALRA